MSNAPITKAKRFNLKRQLFVVTAVLPALAGCASVQNSPSVINRPAESCVADTLDSLHAAAAKADERAYFDLYAKDAVFLGTDAKERWTLEEFKAFAHPYFAKGKAWTYIPVPGTRHIVIEGKDHDVAWFDEQLDNAKLGRCRGSGVLLKTATGWKVKQYNLTMLVPNEVAEQVAKLSQGAK